MRRASLGAGLSTWMVQFPHNETFRGGFDPATHASLVLTNWIRTLGWTARAALVLWMELRLLCPRPTSAA